MTVNAPSVTEATAPMIVKHPNCPEWGLGFLLEERDDKRFYDFEDGLNHSIAKAFWSKLEPVQLSNAEARALEKKVRGLRETRSSSGKSRPRAAAPDLKTFEAQFARFESMFPGGFSGEAFIAEERGEAGKAPGKKAKGFKESAVATAQRALGREELGKLLATPAEVVARVKEVHKAAGNLLHPLGDLIPFSKMPAERHADFAKATFDLLHGDGAFDARFDAFVAVLAKDNLATWPLVTVLGALVAPSEHLFVKPSFLEKQAALMGFDLRYERVPTAAGYARMVGLAREVERRLVDRGQKPRDMLDIYAFVWRTLSPPKKA
jgi:hypothetical protein